MALAKLAFAARATPPIRRDWAVKWLVWAWALTLLSSPSVGRAAPILDQGLQYIHRDVRTAASPGGSTSEDFPVAVGTIGRSFSGQIQSVSGALAVTPPIGNIGGHATYLHVSSASDSAFRFNHGFRVNQPGIDVLVSFQSIAFTRAISVLTADASAAAFFFVAVSLICDEFRPGCGAIGQRHDQTESACSTTALECVNEAGAPDTVSFFLEYLVEGTLIDITGFGNTTASANSYVCIETACSIGLGVGVANIAFSVAVVPEPPGWLLLGTGLLLAGLLQLHPVPK